MATRLGVEKTLKTAISRKVNNFSRIGSRFSITRYCTFSVCHSSLRHKIYAATAITLAMMCRKFVCLRPRHWNLKVVLAWYFRSKLQSITRFQNGTIAYFLYLFIKIVAHSVDFLWPYSYSFYFHTFSIVKRRNIGIKIYLSTTLRNSGTFTHCI